MLSAHNIAEVNAGEPVELPDMVLCGVDKSGDLHYTVNYTFAPKMPIINNDNDDAYEDQPSPSKTM